MGAEFRAAEEGLKQSKQLEQAPQVKTARQTTFLEGKKNVDGTYRFKNFTRKSSRNSRNIRKEDQNGKTSRTIRSPIHSG